MPKLRKWQDHVGELIDSANGFDIIECNSCGFRHVVPLPTKEQLTEYYSKQFYEDRPLLVDKYEEDREWLELCYKERYESFEKFLSSGRRKLLEIGSGLGSFLRVGKQRSWDVIGVEPSTKASQYSENHGVTVVNALFSAEKVAHLDRFDVVHMDDVMEHLPDPDATLQQVRAVLADHGLISIISPNEYNPLQTLLREHFDFAPWWLSPPVHLSYFSFDSMTALLEKNGFNVVERTTSFPMEFFLTAGDNYIQEKELGSVCHDKRKAFEINLYKGELDPLRQKLYRAFAAEGVGRHIVIVAQKQS